MGSREKRGSVSYTRRHTGKKGTANWPADAVFFEVAGQTSTYRGVVSGWRRELELSLAGSCPLRLFAFSEYQTGLQYNTITRYFGYVEKSGRFHPVHETKNFVWRPVTEGKPRHTVYVGEHQVDVRLPQTAEGIPVRDYVPDVIVVVFDVRFLA